ncbi:MAG: hypothetical protein U9Q12_00330 [Patescibacteria group bacterium]|nr:hypothetical protein [Patescibacteria group bacterium]
MIAHLRSLIFTLIFFITFESLVSFLLLGEQWGFAVVTFLILFAVFAGWNVGKKIIFSFLPLSLTISSIGLLYFIDSTREQQIFGFLISLLFYISLLGIKRICKNPLDMTARSLFSAALIAIVFLFYAVVYGLYINFNIPLWLFIGGHFIFITFITFVSLRAYSSDYRRIFLYSIVIAFAMIQLVWMANFWPFGYLTMATISLMFYYVLWDLVQMVFLETLSKKRIVITIIYCIVLTLAVLLTTQWLLVG